MTANAGALSGRPIAPGLRRIRWHPVEGWLTVLARSEERRVGKECRL